VPALRFLALRRVRFLATSTLLTPPLPKLARPVSMPYGGPSETIVIAAPPSLTSKLTQPSFSLSSPFKTLPPLPPPPLCRLSFPTSLLPLNPTGAYWSPPSSHAALSQPRLPHSWKSAPAETPFLLPFLPFCCEGVGLTVVSSCLCVLPPYTPPTGYYKQHPFGRYEQLPQ